ncbi:MAG: mismatch-specific DNA-glycosylase [bacterium]|nr:mismatch-specific DNA-glycosylase [bacterium]
MLPDYLQPGLNLVFVGFNPSLRSAHIGHYYAGRGNQFWRFLFEAGFTDRLLTPEEDALLPTYGIGLTDLVKRATRGIGDLVPKEYRTGLVTVQQKLAAVQPRVICFNGKTGYRAAVNRPCDYGLQPERFADATLYLAPSTSGALPMPRTEKLAYYKDLKTLIPRTGPNSKG